jgi:hypothetical protein
MSWHSLPCEPGQEISRTSIHGQCKCLLTPRERNYWGLRREEYRKHIERKLPKEDFLGLFWAPKASAIALIAPFWLASIALALIARGTFDSTALCVASVVPIAPLSVALMTTLCVALLCVALMALMTALCISSMVCVVSMAPVVPLSVGLTTALCIAFDCTALCGFDGFALCGFR